MRAAAWLRWNTPGEALAAITFAGIVLMLLVLASSDLLRLAAGGIGCGGEPACLAQTDAAARAGEPPRSERVARALHRVAASAVGAVTVAIALLVWMRRPRCAGEVAIAAAALALTLFLAVLGRAARAFDLPAVVLGNVIGGTLLLLLFQWLHLRTRPARPGAGDAVPPVLAAALLCAAFAHFALATLVSAHQALAACAPATGCSAVWAVGVPVFNPLRALDAQLDAGAAAAAREALVLGRRGAAIALFAASAALAVLLRRRHPGAARLAFAVCAALLLQAALAAFDLRGGPALAGALAHDLLGIAVLMLLLGFAHAGTKQAAG